VEHDLVFSCSSVCYQLPYFAHTNFCPFFAPCMLCFQCIEKECMTSAPENFKWPQLSNKLSYLLIARFCSRVFAFGKSGDQNKFRTAAGRYLGNFQLQQRLSDSIHFLFQGARKICCSETQNLANLPAEFHKKICQGKLWSIVSNGNVLDRGSISPWKEGIKGHYSR